jgi:predicted GTPase
MNWLKPAITLFTLFAIAVQTQQPQPTDNFAFIDHLFNNIVAFQLKVDSMISQMEMDEEAGAIIVIGDTGAGKSTFINCMIGSPLKPMQVRNRKDLVLDNDEDDPPLPIGHDHKSKTKEPVMFLDNSDRVWVDTPGFEDT